MPRAYVAIGSNVEPERNVPRAIAKLEREFAPVALSPAYSNRAVGFEGADFVNLVAALATELSLQELVARLRRIEALCGRPADSPKWGPRTIDLDILLYGDLVSSDPKVPRPDLLKRSYMLRPLADIAPHVVHPTEGLTIRELWERFDRDAHPLVPLGPVRR
jgi:2-amino-4-hydroxy-6-hydroxymethyldihydropteridine diphosphokinase